MTFNHSKNKPHFHFTNQNWKCTHHPSQKGSASTARGTDPFQHFPYADMPLTTLHCFIACKLQQ